MEQTKAAEARNADTHGAKVKGAPVKTARHAQAQDLANPRDSKGATKGKPKTAKTSEKAATTTRKRRTHMRAAEREQAIIEEAVRFFAEHGFEGQTRELAKRMGITHSAIYRHIPSKEALIERVYEHVYLSRWRPDWATLIADRSQSLEDRLTRFYLEYVERVFDYHWVRIFAFSGLKSFDITSRYLSIIGDRIIRPACAELRRELNLPPPEESPITERETELLWGLHGRIFYIAIRRYVYVTSTPEDLTPVVRDAVRIFRQGVEPIMREILGAPNSAATHPVASSRTAGEAE